MGLYGRLPGSHSNHYYIFIQKYNTSRHTVKLLKPEVVCLFVPHMHSHKSCQLLTLHQKDLSTKGNESTIGADASVPWHRYC